MYSTDGDPVTNTDHDHATDTDTEAACTYHNLVTFAHYTHDHNEPCITYT